MKLSYQHLVVFSAFLIGFQNPVAAQFDDVSDHRTASFTAGTRGGSAMQSEGTVQAGNFVPGFDGNLHHSTVYDGQIHVAGSASAFNDTWLGLVSRWNAGQSRWEPLGDGLQEHFFGISVVAMKEFDGRLFVGGNFLYRNPDDPETGNESNLVAWNGDVWTGIGTFQNTVNALEVHEGKLMIGTDGGELWEYDGESLVLVPGRFNAVIRSLRSHGSDLLIGGQFTSHTLAGTVHRIARMSGDGSLEPMGQLPMNNTVSGIRTFEEQIVIFGTFTTIGSDSVHRVAAYDPQTQTWGPLGQGLRGFVSGLFVRGSEWTAHGEFTTESGGSIRNLARFDGMNWLPIETRNGSASEDRWMMTVLEIDGVIHASLGNINSDRQSVTFERLVDGAWSPLQAIDVAGNGIPGQVSKILPIGSTLYAAGNFNQAGMVPAQRAARWTPETGWRPMGDGFNDFVRRMVEYRGEVIVGGNFTASGSTPLNRVARWNAQESIWEAMGNGFNGTVQRLRVHDDTLYSVGTFSASGSDPMQRAAYWNPATSSWSVLNPAITGFVFDVAGSDAGNFLAIGGNPGLTPDGANVLIRAGGGGGVWLRPETIREANGASAQVRALCYHEGVLYAAASASQNDHQVYRLNEDGVRWEPVGGQWVGTILDMAVYEGALHIGGFMTNTVVSGPEQIVGVAKWDAELGEFVKLGGGLNPYAVVNNLTPTLTGLYIAGGSIRSHGSTVTSGFSKWTGSGAVSVDEPVRVTPQAVILAQNYPNPFNPSTEIRFELATAGRVRLAVFDILGREIAVLVDAEKPIGTHTATFDAVNLTSGVYLYVLDAGGTRLTRKMLLMK